MDYEKVLSDIAKLAEESRVTLGEAERDTIKSIISAWEASRPVKIDYPDGVTPRIFQIFEAYTAASASSYSGSSYAELHNPRSTLFVRQMTWADGYNLAVSSKEIPMHKMRQQVDAAVEAPVYKVQSTGSLKHYYELEEAKNRVGSLSAIIAAHLLTLTGKYQYKEVGYILGHHENLRLAPYFEKFAEFIEPEIHRLMKQSCIADLKFIAWLQAGGDEKKSLYRKQAVSSYPLFANFFMDLGKDTNSSYSSVAANFPSSDSVYKKLHEGGALLNNAINNGQEIVPILQKEVFPFPLSRATLKNIGKIKEYPEGIPLKDLVYALSYMDGIETKYQPQTKDDLVDYVECVKRAVAGAPPLDCHPSKILAEIKGDWARWKKRTVSQSVVSDVKDWLAEITRAVVDPMMWRGVMIENLERSQSGIIKNLFNIMGGSVPSIRKMSHDVPKTSKEVLNSWIKHVPFADLVECSERWHKDAEEYRAQYDALGIAKYNELASWLPLSEPMQAPNGLWIRPLTSRKQLIRQGNTQSHCVGNTESYFTQCLAGNDHIVSISRDKDNQDILTTVQLREKKVIRSEIHLTVQQHQGYERRAPTPTEAETVEWYCNTLNHDKKYKPDWDAIRSAKEAVRKKRDNSDIVSKIGFDPQNHETCKLAYEIVRPYLPRSLEKLHYESALLLLKGRAVNDNIGHLALQKA